MSLAENVSICIGCGCDDNAACWDEEAGTPCSWLVVDRDEGLGVCSCCRSELERWERGEREQKVPFHSRPSVPPFRCPEHLNKYRVAYQGQLGDETHGFLKLKERGLAIMFANSWGWEHVSVSRKSKMPSWQDMDWVRRQFWRGDCTVMQLHVPEEEHIDLHPYCLHMWRPVGQEVPKPPHYFVAAKMPKGGKTRDDQAAHTRELVEGIRRAIEDPYTGRPY